MTSPFGRDEQINWPSEKPVWIIGAVVVALLAMFLAMWLQYECWTPVQRFYLPTYAWTNWTGNRKTSTRLLVIRRPDGSDVWPREEDIQEQETRTPDGAVVPLALSDPARQAGKTLVLRRRENLPTDWLREALKHDVYGDASPMDLFHFVVDVPFYGSLGVLVSLLLIAIPKDRQRARVRRYGQRVRGPELVSV